MQSILMSGPISNVVLREMLETGWRIRWRIGFVVLVIMLGGLALAISAKPKYKAESSVLIIPGAEYTVRSTAGTNTSVNQSLTRTEILGTEVAILESDDLHRLVLRDLGVATVFPEIAAPPGLLSRLVATGRAQVMHLLHRDGVPPAPAASPDPLETAVISFDGNFTAVASAESNTINITFSSPDAQLAAQVLRTLERIYLERRRSLFEDRQAGAVQSEAQSLRDRLDEADRRLADFKLAHDISNFASRQEILSHQRGEAETGLMAAQSDVDQQKARVAQLQEQLARLPKQITSADVDIDSRLSAARITLDALIAKRADVAARYTPGSEVLATLDAQIASRQADLARSRADRTASAYRASENPVYISVNTDLAHARADLEAAEARQQKGAAQIAAIVAEEHALNLLERDFTDLEQQQQQAKDNYADTAKILTERRVIEQVQSTQQTNARVMSDVAVPTVPAPTRKVIVIVSVFLSVVAGALMVLARHYTRRGFLLAGSLERDCGIPVLVVIPDLAGMAGGRPPAIRPL